MAKKTATLILNRNLPQITDQLYELVDRHNGKHTDIFVIESGSDADRLSQHHTWWANWPDALEHGLRAPRGFNFGLQKLYEEGKYQDYDFFFLITNDTVLEEKPIISILIDIFDRHPRLGILSPCSKKWGEAKLLGTNETKYFWFVHNVAYVIRREFIDSIREIESPNYLNFLYDGSNFRGYHLETELIAKGYANDWATGITTEVWAEENEEYLEQKAKLIKTEEYEVNRQMYIEEGQKWLRAKYGFNSRWTMQMYAKFLYEEFFKYYPEFISCKI